MEMDKKYRIAIAGLGIGQFWAKSVFKRKDCELAAVFDPAFETRDYIDKALFDRPGLLVAQSYEELFSASPDVMIVASPDHLHCGQTLTALKRNCHVICEKPLAPTVGECKKIIAAVNESGKFFMTGQVCRCAPGFQLAKRLVDEGRIGEIACISSQYAHNYKNAAGHDQWRKDPQIGRETFLGGGCHAMDLLRWIAGEPDTIFCVENHMLMPDWPKPDSAFAVVKFHSGAIGKLFVSSGVNAPYSMRTEIYGTKGTIICDNTSEHLLLRECTLESSGAKGEFAQVPVKVANHNFESEFNEFIDDLNHDTPPATDAVEGMKTVAFAQAGIASARSGKPVKISDHL